MRKLKKKYSNEFFDQCQNNRTQFASGLLTWIIMWSYFLLFKTFLSKHMQKFLSSLPTFLPVWPNCYFTYSKCGNLQQGKFSQYHKNGQSRLKFLPNKKEKLQKLPKILKCSPKWRNFVKSGHTASYLHQIFNVYTNLFSKITSSKMGKSGRIWFKDITQDKVSKVGVRESETFLTFLSSHLPTRLLLLRCVANNAVSDLTFFRPNAI